MNVLEDFLDALPANLTQEQREWAEYHAENYIDEPGDEDGDDFFYTENLLQARDDFMTVFGISEDDECWDIT